MIFSRYCLMISRDFACPLLRLFARAPLVFAAFSALAGGLQGQSPSLIWDQTLLSSGGGSVMAGTVYKPVARLTGGNGSYTCTLRVWKEGSDPAHPEDAYDVTSTGNGSYTMGGMTNTQDHGNRTVRYYATAVFRNMYGNVVPPTLYLGPVSVQVYVPDSGPPNTVTGLTVLAVGSNQFTLGWNATTDPENSPLSRYEVGVDVSGNGSNVSVVGLVGAVPVSATYSYVHSGLSPGGTYPMTVRALDQAGNYSAWSPPLNVTIPVPDATNPTTPGAISYSYVGAASAAITWGAATDNVGVAGYRVSVRQGGVNGVELYGLDTNGSTLGIELPNLTASTSYGVTVVARDAVFNYSLSPATSVFSTTPVGGSGPLTLHWDNPIFSNPLQRKVASGVAYTPIARAMGGQGLVSLRVRKTTGTPYDQTTAGYAYAMSGTSSTVDTGNFVAHFTATADQPATNTQLSQSVGIKIYVPDSGPPNPVTGLTVLAMGTNQFTLGWNATTDPENNPLTTYEVGVFANATDVVGVAWMSAVPYTATYSFTYNGLTFYPNTGLVAGNTYRMVVRAKDWADNLSAWSVPLDVTIPVPDITKPTKPGNPTFSNVTTTSATATWTASTDTAPVTYTVSVRQGGTGGAELYSLSTTATTVLLPNLTGGATYGVVVLGRDPSGNISDPGQSTFSTPAALAPGPLFASSIQATSISLYWNAFTVAPATASYIVECNGVQYPAGTTAGAPNLLCTVGNLQPDTAYTLRLQAVGTTGGVSSWSEPIVLTTDYTDATLVALPAVTRPSGSGSLVAAAGAALSVDNHGSANATVPLQSPLGRGGLQPSLALNYNSGGGNGPAGLGWALSTGFPTSVVRGRSIFARDGEVRGVEFNANDKFYLDGKRLILVGGGTQYGAPGTIYRTEVDSFLTVTTAGTGANIETFTVTDKSGTKSVFGRYAGETDALHKAGSEPGETAYAYALKRVEDSLGNYVTFTYANFGGGEHMLTQIDYTGGSGIEPAARVLLAYEGRPDQPLTYLANRSFNRRARLAVVTAQNNSGSGYVTTAAYGLHYASDPNGGRSRLVEIAPVLADPSSGALQTVPSTVINWPSASAGLAAPIVLAPAIPPGGVNLAELFRFGDTAGNGKEVLMSLGGGLGIHNFAGELNGDGRKDIVTVSGTNTGGPTTPPSIWLNASLAGIGQLLPAGGVDISVYFKDPPGTFNQSGNTYLLLAAEGEGVGGRITLADYTGDGRDDVLIHAFDGGLYLFETMTGGFKPVRQVAAGVGGAGMVQQAYYDLYGHLNVVPPEVMSRAWVNAMPCDLNGDGRTDYAYVETTRIIDGTPQAGTFGYHSMRALKGLLSLPNGNFSAPFGIKSLAGIHLNPVNTPNYDFKFVNSGFFPGDFNGDGLGDFLVLDDMGINGHRWLLTLGRGPDATGLPRFKQLPGVLPDSFTLPSSAQVRSYYNPLTAGGWGNLIGSGFSAIFGQSPTPTLYGTLMSLESAAGSTNTFVMDVNRDGLTDLVWYVGSDVNDQGIAAGDKGWYACMSLGRFAAAPDAGNEGSGFSAPVKLDFLQAVVPSAQSNYPQSGFNATRITSGIDYDGDGHPDYVVQNTTNGALNTQCSVYLAKAADNASPAFFNDVVTSLVDGLGRITTVEYKAAKDDAVYTPGADVSYPIRELRGSNPVVSDVWHDSGVTGQPAQFSYQYSGNRLDLSGRGSLGFHAFVTLDRQTNLFKYQFLTQSFPMTGLTHRDETYRWNGGTSFNIISSHDNTVVFDKVVRSPADPTAWGSLWPFVSQATEYRWELGAGGLTTAGSNLNSDPKNLFATAKPYSAAHIAIRATSAFDNATPTQHVLPAEVTALGYRPSDLDGLQNKVVGSQNNDPTLAANAFSKLPGKITYGNLTNLTTSFERDAQETTTHGENLATDYFMPAEAGGLTGLVKSVSSTVIHPSPYNTAADTEAPVKRYTYWKKDGTIQTPLIETETTDATGTALDLTTTYHRGDRGRVEWVKVDGAGSQGPVIIGALNDSSMQHIGSFKTSTVSEYDDRFDLPEIVHNAESYAHTTATTYHSFLGLPTSVTDVNSAQVSTEYDALGRVVKVTDQFNLVTTTSYVAVAGGFTITPPDNFNGYSGSGPANPIVPVSLSPAYKLTVAPPDKPEITTYFDRLGRPIRTVKQGFGGTLVYTDTAYNNLGQVVATSLPYLSTTSPLWTKTTYDDLGRVLRVITPNQTDTTTTYAGRLTTVTVDAIDRLPQKSATLVDAKGRTVKVWNPNPASGELSGTVSVEFDLDGFGRMRRTLLEGIDDQAHRIEAGYDPLGRQTSLIDPDKGTWHYVNNALGHVVKQTDANQNVTRSTFDRLGRPLTRQTTSGATTETAEFFYYDSAPDATRHTVAKGAKGWIGALQRDQSYTTGALGYAAANSATTTTHYYNAKGQPELTLNQIDGTWFYSHTTYDAQARPWHVRYYWRPATAQAAGSQPYTWQDFGYTYGYDTKSYLTSITDSLGRLWWDSPAYDHLDRVTSVRKGSAYVTTRGYRASDGVLESISTGGGAIQNLSFGFDGLGNLISRTGPGGTETLAYDHLNRLANSTKQGATSYLPNGNILTKFDVSGTASGTYAYNGGAYANPADTTPVRTLPHAVSAAYGFTEFKYDLNGNLTRRSKAGDTTELRYAGFDKPRWMTRTQGAGVTGSEFLYNANRSRIIQLEYDSLVGTAPNQTPGRYVRKRVYGLGPTLEANYDNTAPGGSPASWALKKVRLYVSGPDGTIGAREFDITSGLAGTEQALVYHHDHLGSIESITPFGSTAGYASDTTGKSGRFSEDAWGLRRSPTNWLAWHPVTNPATTDDGGPDSLTPRGFTGHEMLDDLGLVHMNGRIYDPLLGRFLSADILVQSPGNLQAYNRYSYVFNNPLSYTDPSGFLTKEEEEKKKKAAEEARRRRIDERGAAGATESLDESIHAGSLASDAASGKADGAQTASSSTKRRVDGSAISARNGDSIRLPLGPNGSISGPTLGQYKSAWRRVLSRVYPNPVAQRLFNHYLDGSGDPITLSEKEMGQIGARIDLRDSPEIRGAIIMAEMGVGGLKGVPVKFHVTPAGAHANGTLGHFTVYGEGTVTLSRSAESPGWYFSGTMSFYDQWDFNKADRQSAAEARVAAARNLMPGKSFEITSDLVSVSQWQGRDEASWSGGARSKQASDENTWLSGINPHQ